MSESLNDLLNRLIERLEPGQTLLEKAYDMLYFLTGDEQIVAHLLDVLGVHIEVCVFDTCMFLDDIKYALKKRRQTALPHGVKLGGVKVFASVNVRDEMPRKITELMPQWGIDPQEALRVWKMDYVPWIRFVDPSGMPLVNTRLAVLELRDPTDLQTGQLIELHPHAVISNDADLASFDTISQYSAIVTCAYRDKGKREAIVVYLNATGIFALKIAMAALSSLLELVCKVDKRILLGALLFLLVAGGAAWLYRPSRTWLQERFFTVKPRVQASLWRVGDSLQVIMEDYERLRKEAEKANAIIAASRRITEPPKTVRDYASRILANATGPLSVAELSRRMQKEGYVPRGRHPEIYLLKVLYTHPGIFGMDDAKRWYTRGYESA